MYLSENIRYLRLKNGYTQEDIAKKLGYKSFTTIQKWESGVSEPPIKMLKELSNLFGIDMDELNNRKLSLGENDSFYFNSISTTDNQKSTEQQLTDLYGKSILDAINLYSQLDSDDQGEIRGEMKQMLKSKKYLKQRKSKQA